MDYKKPMGPGNNITLGLAMYRPKNPKGMIFFNPGGSDEATNFAWQAALNLTDTFVGLKQYDLMMMDTRGTYGSNPLNVSLEAFEPLLQAYPKSQAEFDKFREASAAVAQSWSQLNEPKGILEFIGTTEFVQDWEAIRQALGYKTVSIVGNSYGTYRGLQYAATFPHRVDQLVLDAILPYGQSVVQWVPGQVAALNRALLRVDAYCQNNVTCPFRSKGRGSVVKAFQTIVKEAGVSPLNASQCGQSVQCISPVDASHIRQGLQNALAGAPDFPMILEATALALSGDASGFAIAAGDPLPDISYTWAIPHPCNDQYFGNVTFESFQTHGATSWPFKAPPNKPLPTQDIPMLLVTADFDASTPTEWARSTFEGHPKSALVIRHGDDHVSFIVPGQPSNEVMKEYLRTGVLPVAREGKLFSVYRSGTKLPPVKDPYQVATGAVAGDIDSGP